MYYIDNVHPIFVESVKPATCVTVITNGNVFVTEGIGAGTIMKYDDWLILADSEPIMASTPIPAFTPEHAMCNVELPPLAIGAKIKWVLNEETYRIAIQTANGLLQVKSVTDGGGECDTTKHTVGGIYPLMKKMFADEAAWRASLPYGGVITVTSGPRSKGEQLAEAYNEHLDDRDKLQEYMRRFNVRSEVVENGDECYMKTPAAARIRVVIGVKVYEVALKGDEIVTDIALREMNLFAPVRLFKSIAHIKRALGTPCFYALHYGRKIQLPNL